MAVDSADMTIVLNNHAAPTYARLIKERFPQVRVIIAPDSDTLKQHIAKADALVSARFPVEMFEQATRLRWFQCLNSGIDSILPIRDRLGPITVTNARGIHGDVIADFVMGGVAMLHWNFRGFLQEQTEKQWNPRSVRPLAEHTLGIVGLGSIGATIARRAKSAGMTVVGSKRDRDVTVAGVDRVFGSDELADMLPLCDFVVLAVPATSDTLALLGAEEIAHIKPGAFLINIARGDVVVEAELIKALQRGTIAGAMLDVFEREPLPTDSPLWDMPNVIVTPHVAGNPTGYAERVFSIIGDNIDRFLNGQPLKNIVDVGRGY